MPTVTIRAVPGVAVATVYWLSALIVPLTSGVYWQIAVAPRVERAHHVRFASDAISALPVEGGSWVVQPWLSTLLFAAAHAIGGSGGLALLAAVVAALVGIAIYGVARTACERLPALACALLALPLLFPLALASQLLATLLFALVALALLRGRWWLVPPVVAVWTNVHGSAVIALTLCALAAAGRFGAPTGDGPRLPSLNRLRGRVIWLAVCTAGVFVTPLGLGLVGYVGDVTSIPHLQELTPIWRSLHPFEWRFDAVVLATLAVGGGLIATGIRIDRWTPALPLALYGALAIKAERHIAWFAIVFGYALAVLLARLAARRGGRRGELDSRLVAGVLVGVCAFGVVGLWPGSGRQQRFSLAALPTGLLVSLDRTSRVYASLEWADYLRVATGATVYADARLERYQDDELRRYLDATAGRTSGLRPYVRCDRGGEPTYTHLLLRRRTGGRLIDRAPAIARDLGMEARTIAGNEQGALIMLECPRDGSDR